MNVKSVRNDCGPVIACTMIGQDMTFFAADYKGYNDLHHTSIKKKQKRT